MGKTGYSHPKSLEEIEESKDTQDENEPKEKVNES